MNSYLLVLAVLAASAVAMPRYALVPVEELQYRPQVRLVRSPQNDEVGITQYRPRAPVEELQYRPRVSVEEQEYAPSDRYERQAGPGSYGGEQVDYGAYTGGHGAFGWYADYPVYSYGH